MKRLWGYWGDGRCPKSFPEDIRFIVTKYGTIPSHGDSIHDKKNATFGRTCVCQDTVFGFCCFSLFCFIYMFLFFLYVFSFFCFSGRLFPVLSQSPASRPPAGLRPAAWTQGRTTTTTTSTTTEKISSGPGPYPNAPRDKISP